jgi:prolipoprotein diacylglyceryltransferase
VLGARVAYVANHLGSNDSPLEWFAIWNGGILLLGGIAGGLALGLPAIRRAGLPLWPVLDGIAHGLALGIAIGRVGDLVVADHLGSARSATDLEETGVASQPGDGNEVVERVALPEANRRRCVAMRMPTLER